VPDRRRQAALAILLGAWTAQACTPRPRPGLALPPGAASIEIGELQSCSGPLAAQGLAFHRGLERGLAEQNARGGIQGRPLVLHVLDDRGRPAEARLAMQRLVGERGVIAVVGGASAELTRAAEEAAAGVPFLSPFGGDSAGSGSSLRVEATAGGADGVARDEARGYECARLLVEAIERARTIDAPDLWAALRSARF